MLWKLTPVAEQAIDGLRDEGVQPTPQEVLYIQQLSLDVVAPKSGISLCKGAPVEVGGATLWPLTIAASTWYGEIMQNAWASSMKMEVYCMAFAMCFGHEPGLIDLKGIKARFAVRLWAMRLRCTVAELAQAIADVSGDEKHVRSPREKRDDDNPSRVTESALAQQAVLLCGGTPEFWETQVSMEYVNELVERGMRLKSAVGAGAVEESAEALAALAHYVDEVRKAHKEDAAK